MDTTDAERLERRISELENYVLALERQINKLNSEERIIVEDAHCLIQFFARLCDCCGVKHTINAGVLGKVVGSASANPLLVAGSAGLFGAGVVTKAAHQGIHARVDLYHKIRRRQVKPSDVVKAGQQLSNSVRSTEKVFNPDSVQYA